MRTPRSMYLLVERVSYRNQKVFVLHYGRTEALLGTEDHVRFRPRRSDEDLQSGTEEGGADGQAAQLHDVSSSEDVCSRPHPCTPAENLHCRATTNERTVLGTIDGKHVRRHPTAIKCIQENRLPALMVW